MNRVKIFLLSLICATSMHAQSTTTPKIIGLVPMRNEATIAEQCLRALAVYADAIIVLDDASTDGTVALLERLATELPIVQIIKNDESAHEYKIEADNRQALLDAGRAFGGTHFIVLDADEMFTANCTQGNWLRNQIVAMHPGQVMNFKMPHLWKGMDYYRNDDSRWSPDNCWCGCIFCDDGKASMKDNQKDSFSGFIHMNRLPGKRYNTEPDIFIQDINYSLVHFRFCNWHNIEIKRVWYMCLEMIRAKENLSMRQKNRGAGHINAFYKVIEDYSEANMILEPISPAWFDYPFFNKECFMQDITWRTAQIIEWFKHYGVEFFKPLDIWRTIDWHQEIMKLYGQKK